MEVSAAYHRGEVVSPSESCNKAGRHPCTRPACPMKAVTLDPPGMEERVCDLLSRSLNVNRPVGAGAEAGLPVRGSRLVCLHFSPQNPQHEVPPAAGSDHGHR